MAVLLAAATALAAHAQSSGAQPDQGIDPKADEIFSRMSAHLAQARQFSLQSTTLIDHVLDSGLKLQLSRRSRIVVRRPDALAAKVEGDVDDLDLWYQGTRLTLLDRRANTYAQVQVPDNLDEMFDYMAVTHGFVVPLCDLLFSDPREAALARVYRGVYVGLHDVNGVKCHHLAFRQPGADWQIWIQDGDQPLPRKVVISYKDLPGAPQFIAFLDQWNLEDHQPETVFQAQLPADAKRVEMPVLKQAAEERTRPAAPAGAKD